MHSGVNKFCYIFFEWNIASKESYLGIKKT